MFVLCSEVDETDLDAHDILRALRCHGWVISSEEQDAHELFHALTSTIDDELALIKQQSNSLLNVSWVMDKIPPKEDSPIGNKINSNVSMPLSDTSPSTPTTATKNEGDSKEPNLNGESQVSESNVYTGFYKTSSIIAKVPFLLNEQLLSSNGSLLSESPFKGHLASQLQCTACGLKSAEQWSSFESISLSLPGIASMTTSSYSLQELLDNFIHPECVSDVTCDSCTKSKGSKCTTTFTKQLTVGKLPECLCIHVQRTVWLGNGYAFKRRDHILIPEVLNMDPYTYAVSLDSQSLKGRLLGGSQTNITTDISQNEHLTLPFLRNLSNFSAPNPINSDTFQYTMSRGKQLALYRLQAVVVHVGDVLTGHFITYRRGSKETCSEDRWFYTSDLVVREASLREVLDSNAYMILYERSLLGA